ncbi:hypothetical protein HZC31_05375 [Candidatus Woesearchaeota archaeon]|nr:hypothetical protein [Candidatus Woesearchaeota archaeon]
MNNVTRVIASIGSAMVPITAAYWNAGTYLHQKLVESEGSPLYQSLENCLADTTGFTDPDRVTLIGTALVSVGLCKVAYEVGKPIVQGFAYLYNAKLE